MEESLPQEAASQPVENDVISEDLQMEKAWASVQLVEMPRKLCRDPLCADRDQAANWCDRFVILVHHTLTREKHSGQIFLSCRIYLC
jgi:hypothetical protein